MMRTPDDYDDDDDDDDDVQSLLQTSSSEVRPVKQLRFQLLPGFRAEVLSGGAGWPRPAWTSAGQ